MIGFGGWRVGGVFCERYRSVRLCLYNRQIVLSKEIVYMISIEMAMAMAIEIDRNLDPTV